MSAAILTGVTGRLALWVSTHKQLTDIVIAGRGKYYIWKDGHIYTFLTSGKTTSPELV